MAQSPANPPPAAPAPKEAAPVAPVERRRFPLAPPDRQVIAVTALFIVTLLWFGGQILASLYLGEPPNQGDIIFSVLVAGIIIWRWLNSVRGYVLQTGGGEKPALLVLRWTPWGTVRVPLERLRSVDPAPKIRGILNMSFLSQGSLFGWSGPANVPELGTVLAYAMNGKRLVVLELAPRADDRYQTSDGKEAKGVAFLVSPRDPAALADALEPYWRPRPAVAAAPAKAPAPAKAAAPRKKKR
jgi:hypothetical protein